MMDRVRNVGSAAALASLGAGPLMIAAMGISALLSNDPVGTASYLMKGLPGAIVAVTLFGWFFAIVPNLLGTSVLGWLGRGNVGMRMPAVWAIVGAAAAGVPTWLSFGPHDVAGTPAMMAGIGAASALLCRARVRWDDEDAIPPERDRLTPTRLPTTP